MVHTGEINTCIDYMVWSMKTNTRINHMVSTVVLRSSAPQSHQILENGVTLLT